MRAAATPPSCAVAPLRALALRALGQDAILAGAILPSVAPLPTDLAERLLDGIVSHLAPTAESAATAPPLPPLEVLRLFYGGQLTRLKQTGASDDWASEALGFGGLRGLASLSIHAAARLSPYGLAHIGCALGATLLELSVSGCRALGAAGIAAIGHRCPLLRGLRLVDCDLEGVGADGVSPLLGDSLQLLELLELSGGSLGEEAALAICSDRSGRPLASLRLHGSELGDEAATAAMELSSLERLDVGWCRLGGAGAQALAMGVGERLVELNVSHASEMAAGDVGSFVPALLRLATLCVDGLTLDRADVEAMARAARLGSISMAGCRLREERRREGDWHALDAVRALARGGPPRRRLTLDGAMPESLGPDRPPHPAGRPRSLVADADGAGGADQADDAEAGAVRAAPSFRFPPNLEALSLKGCDALLTGPWWRVVCEATRRADGGARLKCLALSGHDATGGAGTASLGTMEEALQEVAPLAGLFSLSALFSSRRNSAVGYQIEWASLERLELAECGLIDLSLQLIAANCGALRHLDVSSNRHLTDDGVAHLCSGRYRLEALRTLLLSRCPMLTHRCAPHLNCLLGLRRLEVDGTAIGLTQAHRAEVAALRRADLAKSEARDAIGRIEAAAAREREGTAAAAPLPRYDASEFRALAGSAWSAVPARSLPMIDGVVVRL